MIEETRLLKKTSLARQKKGRANSITAISLGNILEMSLEIRPLAALYTPPIYIFLDRYNRKWRKCRRHEHTAPVDH